jgi:hypothetical protein
MNVTSENSNSDGHELQSIYQLHNYGNPDCQASQGFAKHVAAANAEVCCYTKAQGGGKDLGDPHLSTTTARQPRAHTHISTGLVCISLFFFTVPTFIQTTCMSNTDCLDVSPRHHQHHITSTCHITTNTNITLIRRKKPRQTTSLGQLFCWASHRYWLCGWKF